MTGETTATTRGSVAIRPPHPDPLPPTGEREVTLTLSRNGRGLSRVS